MNTEKATPRCPQCGSLIPSEAIQGLCPRCVLQGATMGTDSGGRPIRSDPPTLEAIGVAFPQLEIQGLIGRGGMGFVYKARQPKLDRFVALKILPSELSAEPQFIGRFNREARALARLSHPNIVAVYDFGVNQGFCYLLMELVDGVNLRQAMKAGRFTPREALQIVPKICEALQFAHDQGVLHRDIKPENILLDAQGRVKIADFGIAKMAGDEGFDVALTQSGARLGTPVYMAPEQIEKPGDVDHRADIYSLGVVFYELLTGELPLGRFAPPSAKSTYDDERIDAIVMRALAKERELRQQSAGEVKTQVETVSASPPSDRSNPSASIPKPEPPAGAEASGAGAKAGGEENPVGKRIGRVLMLLGRVGVGLMLLTGLDIGWGLVTHPGGTWDGTQALVMLGVTLGSMFLGLLGEAMVEKSTPSSRVTPEGAKRSAFLYARVPVHWKSWILLALGVVDLVLITRLLAMWGSMISFLSGSARTSLVGMGVLALGMFGGTALLRWGWRERSGLIQCLGMELPEGASEQDRWLRSATLLGLAGLVGGLVFGMLSWVVALLTFITFTSTSGGSQWLLLISLLGAVIGLESWRKNGATNQGVRVARPEWMTRYGVVFLVLGGLFLSSVYLPIRTSESTGRSTTGGVWNLASLWLLTGGALLSGHPMLRALALAASGLGLLSSSVGVGSILLMGYQGDLPPRVALPVFGLAASPFFGIGSALVEWLGFWVSLRTLSRRDARPFFGIRTEEEGWTWTRRAGFLVCGVVLVGAWYWWGFLAASTGTLNPKTVVSQPQPVARGGVSDAPVVLDTEPSRVLVDAQGLPERLPEGEPSPAALKWHFAWKRLRERQHQADVGVVAPEGPEIRAARRDVAVAQAEFESNPASADRARLDYAEAMLTIVRKRFEVGRATESEVDEARLAAAEARAAMDGREPARSGVEPGMLPSQP